MRRTRRTLALPLWLSLAAAGAFAGPLACAPTPGETLGTSASFIVSGVATSVVRVAVTATSVPAGRTYTTDLVRVGDTWQGTLSGMLVGAYSFAGTAYDATGNVLFRGSLSSPVTIANNGTSMVALNLTQASQIAAFRNNAPVIDTLVGSSNAIVPSDTISLAATAHDPDADPLTYAWSSSAGTFSAPNALATNWTAPATEGTYTLTLVVSDNRGASTSARYQVRVAAANGRGSAALTVSLNNAPVISGFTVGGNDATGTSNLAVMATDPDGDTLTYSWSSSCAGYFAGSTTNNRALNNSPSPSTTFTQTPATVACTLTVVVRDGMGNSNTATVIRGAGPTTNTNPVVAPSFQSVNGVGNAGTVVLRAEGSDPDGTPVTLAWTTSLGTLSAPRAYTGSAGTSVAQEVTWTAPACFPMGMATVTVTATDPGGLTAARTFTIASTNSFNLQTDATNCGACGNVCPTSANGVAACVAGVCQLSCVSGYHLVGSTCDVNTDTMSCGPTGTLCATPNNAAPTCDGTTCGFACNANYDDCDSDASNGCESSLPTDPNNCGACRHVCVDHGYSTPICNGGSCDFVCRPGYGNCDGDPSNGCETDVWSNPAHCGGCDPCGDGETCSSGQCMFVGTWRGWGNSYPFYSPASIAAASDGSAWVVTGAHNIIHITGETTWYNEPGMANDIGIGSNCSGCANSLWIVTTTPAGSGYTIAQWNGSDWATIAGDSAARISGQGATPWVAQTNGDIYFNSTGAWSGLASGSQPMRDIAASAGLVWGVGFDGRVYYLSGGTWVNLPAPTDMVRIAADPTTRAWVVDTRGHVWREDNRGQFVRVSSPDNAEDIAIGADGTVWITAAGYAWRWLGT